ncbi:MAG TPA: helical backbone metal receptor [Jatrophihabitans sp.]|nr:helical backbone metal receptor [Jatrophihabitans sp.]
MPTVTDDLGAELELPRPVARAVSLVPSLTEAIAASRPELLVGATDWCSQPPELAVARVRGTKNPDLGRIVELAPDLVVCNQEENRELDVRRLRAAGVPVWVTRIETLAEAFRSLERLFVRALAGERPDWLTAAEASWSQPGRLPPLLTVVPIWRDPWMVVGARTFTGDLLARLGVRNAFANSPDRYPKVQLAEIRQLRPELVLLPDEPYEFNAGDGPEAFPDERTELVSGRLLTWYGPSLATARTELEAQLHR